MKGTESFKQTIHSYLEQRASEDTLFAEKYHAVNRSIDDIVTYILNEVMKSECHGFDDDEIYSLAIHAAEEKDLELGKPVECDVKVNHVVELTEEEKQEARRNAIRRLENETYNRISQRSKPKARTAKWCASPTRARHPSPRELSSGQPMNSPTTMPTATPTHSAIPAWSADTSGLSQTLKRKTNTLPAPIVDAS